MTHRVCLASPRWVLLLAAVCLFLFLGTRGLNEPDEGRFAEVAMEMSLQSDWLMPTLCGVPHLQKPPMIYWAAATCIRLFGVHEWVVRLPSALAALGTVALTLHLAGLLFGTNVAWKAGLILLSSTLFFILARLITTDMLLTFWITAAITAYVDAAMRGRRASLLFFYLCLGLGFLTKGPMTLLVSYAAVLPFAVTLKGEVNRIPWRWHWIPGLLLALGIGLSWFLLLFRQYPELVDYFLKYELVDRIASNTHARAKPFWYYAVGLVGGFLPWSILFPRMACGLWTRLKTHRPPKAWLFIGWVFIPGLFLHLMVSKMVTYLLPLLPALAILTAYTWENVNDSLRREIRGMAGLVALLMLGLPIALRIMQQRVSGPDPLSPMVIAAAIIILAGAGWLYQQAGTTLPLNRQLIAISLLMLASLLLIVRTMDSLIVGSNSPVRPMAEKILEVQRATGIKDVYLQRGRRYGFEFYLQQPIIRRANSIDLALPIPAALADRFVDDPAVFFAQNQDRPLLAVTNANRIEELLALASGWRELYRYHGLVLLVRNADVP
ncbi:MAG: glycosyltransferase family 39 protein [Verrucomicrobia bacterium]|nr:glycosyltransferase family 39 protein [Verrucomicrobiota bacterium]